MWKGISPPTREDETTNGWYVAIYQEKKKSYLYVGKATKEIFVGQRWAG